MRSGMQQGEFVNALFTMSQVLDYRALLDLHQRLSKVLENDMFAQHQGGGIGVGGGPSSFRGGHRGDHHHQSAPHHPHHHQSSPHHPHHHQSPHHQHQQHRGGGGRGFVGGFPQDRRRFDDYNRDGVGYTTGGDPTRYPPHSHRGGRDGRPHHHHHNNNNNNHHTNAGGRSRGGRGGRLNHHQHHHHHHQSQEHDQQNVNTNNTNNNNNNNNDDETQDSRKWSQNTEGGTPVAEDENQSQQHKTGVNRRGRRRPNINNEGEK